MQPDVIPVDVLVRLKNDRSKRSAHFACLRAMPFCTECEPIKDGVQRLETWLKIACEIRHRWLEQVVVLVLASIADDGIVVSNGKDLSLTWQDVTRLVVAPSAARLEDPYLATAHAIALCVLYKYCSDQTYSRNLMMSLNPKIYPRVSSEFIHQFQTLERADQSRRKVVAKLVSCAIANVLRATRDESRFERKRCKRERRKMASGLALQASTTTKGATCSNASPAEEPPTWVSDAANECIVCLDELGSKRTLLSCGHARCCHACAMVVHECPLCQVPVRVFMQIFV
jgi:hypothetical protein